MNSFRTKIFAGVLGILAAIAGIVMAYSSHDVRLGVVQAEQRSVGNVLQMAGLAIHTQYLQLLSEKVITIQDRKDAFRKFGDVVLKTLDLLGAQGEADEAAARGAALAWLANLPLVSGEAVFVFDRQGRIVSNTDRARADRDLSGLVDIRGRPLIEGTWSDSQLYGNTFLTYGRRTPGGGAAERKYGYFVPFARWGWMIAIVGDVGDLERVTDLRRADLVRRLRASLGDLKMAGDGFVFIFGGDGRFIVPPKAGAEARFTPAALAELRALAPDGRAVPHLTPLALADGQQAVEAQVFRLKALDWYVAAIVSSAALAEPARNLIVNQGLVFAGGILLAALLAWGLAQRVSRPLVALTQRARGLSNTDFTRPQVRSARPDESRSDEIGRLAEAFSYMEDALYRNVQTVMRVTQERERIEGELNVARDIQLGLLPKIFPAFPEKTEVDIYAELISAKEVGGDLYDFYFLDDRHFCFTIGDVAGKGVPAALFMAITKTLIKSAADRSADPAVMMSTVNDALAKDNANSIFVTNLIGILDCHTGRLCYANGGHNTPLVIRQGGGVETLRPISGPALGVVEDMEYDLLETALAPGETLVLYTDGVTEAMNARHELFEEERLVDLLERQTGIVSAETLVKQIMGAVQAHAGDTPQSDDIAIVALRFTPAGRMS